MVNKQITIKTDLQEGYYRITYRCTNCGTLFEKDLKKGTIAEKAKSSCPYCDAVSGASTVGYFPVIKHNSNLDNQLTKYY